MFLKLMGAMPGYIYAQDKTGIYVNLFVGSKAKIQLADQTVELKQTTEYPWHGDVKVAIERAKAGEFDLHIRVPGWCEGRASVDDLYQANTHSSAASAGLKVNGKPVENHEMIRGYATVGRRWKGGDIAQLTLNMPVKAVKANANVEADRSRLAWMRGPLVYCFEGADNGGAVENLVVPPSTEFTSEYRSDFLGGVMVLNATAIGVFRTGANQVVSLPFNVKAIPYYANANRGTCQMQVWMPEGQELSRAQKQE